MNTTTCLLYNMLCDGVPDCPYADDELETLCNETCNATSFQYAHVFLCSKSIILALCKSQFW